MENTQCCIAYLAFTGNIPHDETPLQWPVLAHIGTEVVVIAITDVANKQCAL